MIMAGVETTEGSGYERKLDLPRVTSSPAGTLWTVQFKARSEKMRWVFLVLTGIMHQGTWICSVQELEAVLGLYNLRYQKSYAFPGV